MKNVVAMIGSAATSSANYILIDYIRSEANDIFQVIVYDKLKTLSHFDPDVFGTSSSEITDLRNSRSSIDDAIDS